MFLTEVSPSVAGDDGASVTGDATSGWTVTPSESATEVVVTISNGVDAAKVTVKVSPETKRVTPNGAAKGAVIDFASPNKPTLTTAPTREGLVYRLKEGATLEAMAADTTGATKVGDGTPWTPTLSGTGGTSGFYAIQVTK